MTTNPLRNPLRFRETAARMLPLLLGVAWLAGCAGPTPLKRWADAQDGFSATLNVLAGYREAGLITPARAAQIEPLLAAGQEALDHLRAAAEAQALDPTRATDARPYLAALDRVLAALLAHRRAIEAGDPPGSPATLNGPGLAGPSPAEPLRPFPPGYFPAPALKHTPGAHP